MAVLAPRNAQARLLIMCYMTQSFTDSLPRDGGAAAEQLKDNITLSLSQRHRRLGFGRAAILTDQDFCFSK